MSNAAKSTVVTGVFSYLDTTTKAVQLVKQRGVENYTVYSPTFIHSLDHEVDDSDSPIRFIVLIGGITGMTLAFLMQWWMGLDWPIRVSAKPPFALPPSTIIMFELTVLIGALSNLAAIFFFCKLPNFNLGRGYDPRFTDDKFGVVIEAEGDAAVAAAEALLREAGAEEVNRA